MERDILRFFRKDYFIADYFEEESFHQGYHKFQKISQILELEKIFLPKISEDSSKGFFPIY